MDLTTHVRAPACKQPNTILHCVNASSAFQSCLLHRPVAESRPCLGEELASISYLCFRSVSCLHAEGSNDKKGIRCPPRTLHQLSSMWRIKYELHSGEDGSMRSRYQRRSKDLSRIDGAMHVCLARKEGKARRWSAEERREANAKAEVEEQCALLTERMERNLCSAALGKPCSEDWSGLAADLLASAQLLPFSFNHFSSRIVVLSLVVAVSIFIFSSPSSVTSCFILVVSTFFFLFPSPTQRGFCSHIGRLCGLL